MLGRFASIGLGLGLGLVAALPAKAEEMKPDEARRFVIGRTFSYTCFEGTRGVGRIYNDGSVVGSIQFQGKGAVRHVTLPPNTLRVKGEAVCASLKGMPMEPCFNLNKTSQRSFRGAVAGLSFAFCDFTSRTARFETASNTRRPRSTEQSVAVSTQATPSD